MNNPNRLWIVATAVISAALIALGGFLGVAPQLAAIAAADASREAVETQNNATATETAALKKQSENIDELLDQVKALQLSIPAELQLMEVSDQISDNAIAAGVAMSNYSVANAIYYTPVAAGGAVVGDPDIATDPTAGGLVTPENFISVEVNATVTSASYSGFIAFVALLQTMPRVFLVTDISISRVEGVYNASFTGLIYVLVDPGTPVVAPGGDEEAEQPTATPTPTDTPSSTPTPTETATATP